MLYPPKVTLAKRSLALLLLFALLSGVGGHLQKWPIVPAGTEQEHARGVEQSGGSDGSTLGSRRCCRTQVVVVAGARGAGTGQVR